jgi:hypothetical protein
MTWHCGNCEAKWPEAVPLCPACAVDEIDRLKKGYGAKFNAISSALGWAGETQKQLEEGAHDLAALHLQRCIDILVDA